MRLDAYLVEQGLARSRPRAKELIAQGVVLVNDVVAKRGSRDISEKDSVLLTQEDHPYVSRGALKLKALVEAVSACEGENFLTDAVVIDVGSSTGGFTQYALEQGAAHVYAVDVGSDQIDRSLKNNPHISVMEQTDARGLHRKNFDPEPSVLVTDVSFISLTKVLPAVIGTFDSIFHLFCLVKPQFEVGHEHLTKNGLVLDEDVRLRALGKVEVCLQDLGFEVVHDMESPVVGTTGNIEYLVYLRRP